LSTVEGLVTHKIEWRELQDRREHRRYVLACVFLLPVALVLESLRLNDVLASLLFLRLNRFGRTEVETLVSIYEFVTARDRFIWDVGAFESLTCLLSVIKERQEAHRSFDSLRGCDLLLSVFSFADLRDEGGFDSDWLLVDLKLPGVIEQWWVLGLGSLHDLRSFASLSVVI